jgi:hypothetical protein
MVSAFQTYFEVSKYHALASDESDDDDDDTPDSKWSEISVSCGLEQQLIYRSGPYQSLRPQPASQSRTAFANLQKGACKVRQFEVMFWDKYPRFLVSNAPQNIHHSLTCLCLCIKIILLASMKTVLPTEFVNRASVSLGSIQRRV